jgi:hypothetical protein
MEMMKQEGRQDILHVPCKGPGPVMRGNIRAE